MKTLGKLSTVPLSGAVLRLDGMVHNGILPPNGMRERWVRGPSKYLISDVCISQILLSTAKLFRMDLHDRTSNDATPPQKRHLAQPLKWSAPPLAYIVRTKVSLGHTNTKFTSAEYWHATCEYAYKCGYRVQPSTPPLLPILLALASQYILSPTRSAQKNPWLSRWRKLNRAKSIDCVSSRNNELSWVWRCATGAVLSRGPNS